MQFYVLNVPSNTDIAGLHHAAGARFDANAGREECIGSTCMEILLAIYRWIENEELPLATGSDRQLEICRKLLILWINGMAGTGKSTIAQTVAHWCDRHGLLGASFFCARFGDRNNIQLIFPTIALHLATHPSAPASFRTAVENAVKANSDINHSLPSYQLEKLIVEPLRASAASGDTLPRHVIVIDALDECKDDEPVSSIVSALSLHANGLRPLKFVVTSRPEVHITTGFRGKALLEHTFDFPLHTVPDDIVQRDIATYIDAKISQFLDGRQGAFKRDWPGVTRVKQLRTMSGGLFIHISTALKYIFGSNDPDALLDALLRNPSVIARGSISSPAAHLYALYLQVLDIITLPEDTVGLRGVLGSIVLLNDQLSTRDLTALLELKDGTVQRTLQHLHSILVVPGLDQPDGVIGIIHPSFPDFILDETRCTRADILVNRQLQHTLLSIQCLRTMKTLHRSVDKQVSSNHSASGDSTEGPVAATAPEHVRYACRYWSHHLREGYVTQEVINMMSEFCNTHLLHWLKTLASMGEVEKAVEALEGSRSTLQVSHMLRHYQRLIG